MLTLHIVVKGGRHQRSLADEYDAWLKRVKSQWPFSEMGETIDGTAREIQQQPEPMPALTSPAEYGKWEAGQ